MKNLILWIALLAASSAFAVTGENFEYIGYLRSGVGSNLKGGDQNCYHQYAVPGNEFRLGNECGIYGESLFRAYTPFAKKADGEFYRANLGISYNPDGKAANEPPKFYIFAAYVEAGRLDGSNSTIWIGRRYYRDGDLHLDDFFYFADTSGSGAGIEQIPLWNGNLAVALMFANTTHTDTVNGATTVVKTENGTPRTLLLDVRLLETKIAEHDRLNFWVGYAGSTGGTDTLTQAKYGDATGYVGGVKFTHDLNQGYSKTALIYGAGLMQGMNLGGAGGQGFGSDPIQTYNSVYDQSAHRLRAVEDLMFQPNSKYAVGFGAIYETWMLQNAGNHAGRYLSIGARPIYFFSDHYSVAFEAGASSVRQSGQAGGGSPMYRLTLAPQVSPKAEFYARPVLRAFLTKTFIQGSPDAVIATSTSFGFQGEVWF